MGIMGWNYVGVICFPNLENRKALQDAEAVNDEDELKVQTIDTFNYKLFSLPFLDGSDKRTVR